MKDIDLRVPLICAEVAGIYDWIDKNISRQEKVCKSCGDCCRFDSFGHRLYVTTPEMIYFQQNLAVTPMTGGACPYMQDGRCTVRDFRFAGCRIFFCRSDEQSQSSLSEQAVEKFKKICRKYALDYRYSDLKTALQG